MMRINFKLLYISFLFVAGVATAGNYSIEIFYHNIKKLAPEENIPQDNFFDNLISHPEDDLDSIPDDIPFAIEKEHPKQLPAHEPSAASKSKKAPSLPSKTKAGAIITPSANKKAPAKKSAPITPSIPKPAIVPKTDKTIPKIVPKNTQPTEPSPTQVTPSLPSQNMQKAPEQKMPSAAPIADPMNLPEPASLPTIPEPQHPNDIPIINHNDLPSVPATSPAEQWPSEPKAPSHSEELLPVPEIDHGQPSHEEKFEIIEDHPLPPPAGPPAPPATSPEGAKKSWRDYLPFNKSNKSPDQSKTSQDPLSYKTDFAKNATNNLQLSYIGEEVDLSETVKPQVHQLIEHAKTTALPIKVVSYNEDDLYEAKKIALQRVINARKYLIENGIAAEKIVVQVLPATKPGLAHIVEFSLSQFDE